MHLLKIFTSAMLALTLLFVCSANASNDPVTADPNTGANFNRYAYANNNPYKYTDPDGRQSRDLEYIHKEAARNGQHTPCCNSLTEKQAGTIVDFTPGFGDAKGIADAYNNPTPANIGAAAVGLFGPVGDAAGRMIKGVDNVTDAAKGLGNTSDGARGTIYVDSKGNAVPTPAGGRIDGSPDGRFIQAKDANGNPTGVRIDGGHRPSTHPDPRAQQPHGHVPGVANPDGTPWLPIKPND